MRVQPVILCCHRGCAPSRRYVYCIPMCTVYLQGLLVLGTCTTNKSSGHDVEKDEEEGWAMCNQLAILLIRAPYGAVFIQFGTRWKVQHSFQAEVNNWPFGKRWGNSIILSMPSRMKAEASNQYPLCLCCIYHSRGSTVHQTGGKADGGGFLLGGGAHISGHERPVRVAEERGNLGEMRRV